MTVRGTIKNGKVVLDDPKAIADGTLVEVRAVKKPRASAKPRKSKEASQSMADRLRSVIGKARNLPPDASVNHDYYLYGLPKSECVCARACLAAASLANTCLLNWAALCRAERIVWFYLELLERLFAVGENEVLCITLPAQVVGQHL